jgi:DNA-binding response OmpR family regulator
VVKILVVDDEKTIRTLYAEELGGEGYEVITTGECEAVSELISSEEVSVVVLDIRMDNCDGLDLLQKLRKDYPTTPIILNTAYESYKDDIKSDAADYYIVKSHDLTELKTRLADIWKR